MLQLEGKTRRDEEAERESLLWRVSLTQGERARLSPVIKCSEGEISAAYSPWRKRVFMTTSEASGTFRTFTWNIYSAISPKILQYQSHHADPSIPKYRCPCPSILSSRFTPGAIIAPVLDTRPQRGGRWEHFLYTQRSAAAGGQWAWEREREERGATALGHLAGGLMNPERSVRGVRRIMM